MKVLWIQIVTLYLTVAHYSFAQVVFDVTKEEKQRTTITGSFYIALNFINPTDVNEYIEGYIEDRLGSSYFSIGSSSINAAGTLGFGLVVPINERLKSKILLEYAGGSKTVLIDEDNETFTINRLAPGFELDYYFPLKSDDAFYFGASLLYNRMWFMQFNANGLGSRIQIGYAIFRFSADWDLYFGMDFATNEVKDNSELSTIDFTAPLFGLRVTF